MNAVEKIMIAEEKVAGLQSQLKTVETVLEKAEEVAVAGAKAGRCVRRSLWVLLAISVVAVIALAVKKVMGDGCPMGKKATDDAESTSDAVVSDVGDDEATGDESAPDGDVDAS